MRSVEGKSEKHQTGDAPVCHGSGAIAPQPLLPGDRSRRPKRTLNSVAGMLIILSAVFSTPAASAQDDMIKLVETKRAELQEREEALKREEQRLEAIKKDVDERIDKYTKLLAQIDALLKRMEKAKDDKLENVVKAYEVMPAEDAAARISALDDETALKIMLRMKSKKAGAVIAQMAPPKAAVLTKRMTTFQVAK